MHRDSETAKPDSSRLQRQKIDVEYPLRMLARVCVENATRGPNSPETLRGVSKSTGTLIFLPEPPPRGLPQQRHTAATSTRWSSRQRGLLGCVICWRLGRLRQKMARDHVAAASRRVSCGEEDSSSRRSSRSGHGVGTWLKVAAVGLAIFAGGAAASDPSAGVSEAKTDRCWLVACPLCSVIGDCLTIRQLDAALGYVAVYYSQAGRRSSLPSHMCVCCPQLRYSTSRHASKIYCG